ncbi:hypothetical protein [Fulvimarina sp. MAC3]|uniref:hypothetical protein n=1 Tax=Fulvimarina sp. MAC3 TaxID=3148887 RepID=UPI0031FDFB7B
MYLDEKNEWQPPERPAHPARPEITERQQKVLGWLILANVAVILVAPIGGASLVHAVTYWIAG